MYNFRRPSSRSASISMSAVHGLNPSMRHRNSIMASSSRRSFSRSSGSKGSRMSEKCASQTPRQLVRVFDDDNNDVTPVPLHQTEPATVRFKGSRFFLDEITVGSASYHTSVAGSLSTPFSRSLFGSTRISSPSVIESINEDIEDPLSKRDFPTHFTDLHWKSDAVAEEVTEEMLKEVIDVYITETESVSLLDIPNTFVSVDSEGAEAIIERNKNYAEICKNRMGNNKYVDRAMQTLNEPVKNKHIQSDCVVMVDTASIVTTWDLYDSFVGSAHEEQTSTHDLELLKLNDPAVDISKGTDLSFSFSSTASTASTASSMHKSEVFGKIASIESELQQIMQSEHFQNYLQIMERTILENIMQPKLAAYRQLPVLKGSPVKPEINGDTRGSQSLSVEQLWAFTCELTQGCSVSSMVWNKRNPDLLAVGYGEFDLSYQNPGLVCCWSLKNHTWPDRFIHCDYAVTCLDFSPNNPSQLAVGMINGTIAIYDVQNQDNKTCVISSCECHNKHMGPVWELKWIQQEVSLTGDEKVEALFSVAADGRICKWLLCNNGLDCIDLMKLNRVLPTKRKKTEQKAESVLSALTPGLCFDFHPWDSSIYLVGTFEGLVHQGSSSNTQHFLEIYRKHSCPVNCLAWSPFSAEAFLTGSSDWTIQLWRRDQSQPVLGFISTQRAVVDVKWSPRSATVFATIKEELLEIWDLSISILDPVIVQLAAPGVKFKALLFALQTDCVLVGDSDGHVTVYNVRNLSQGENNQVEILEVILG